MPQKREVLQLLTRDELVAVVDRFELSVSDRRVKDGLVDAVASSKKATLAEVLPELSRDRLKELCRAFDLDDGGREKSALVERLTGAKAAESIPPSRKNGTHGTSTKAIEPADLPLGDKLTVDRLEGYLWSAADILRGSIDSSDYKNFIFGLLFLKRLSDRFDEECEILVKEGDDPEEKDNHQFFVPRRARWSEIQKVATDLGSTLNKACSQLEEANHSLEGVLAGIDYNDERKLGDARNRDVVLGRLVQHFSKLSLKNTHLSEPDMLGRAYEYLIEKFADDAGKKGGEFYTPRMVVKLIVEMLAPKEGMRICDPTAGSGGMLIECAHYLERHKHNPRNLSLFGQEKNLGTWAICKMNMLLHGLPDARIEKGDTIRDPKLREGGELMLFDRVIANPPFSLDEWGREIAEHDPYGRFQFGVPPKGTGDLAFVQHMIATTNTSGMVGVVMPHGVLFRGRAEGDIRKGILQEDLVEAVVGLPTNLFYGTGIPAAIIVLNRAKRADRKRRVLFIEGSREFKEGSAQNYLREEDVKKIAAAFHAFADVEKYARVVGIDEIEKNDWTLNISRYVETGEVVEEVDLVRALTKLAELESNRAEAAGKMNSRLREMGPGERGWPTAPLGELVDFVNGRAFKPSDWVAEGTPIVRIQNLNGGAEFNYFSGEAEPRFRVSPGDLLFSWSGTRGTSFGPHFWRGPSAILNQHIFNIRNLRGVEQGFLFYALKQITAAIEKRAHGGTGIVHITKGQLEAFKVPVPSIEEQRKIASILSSVDDAIEATQTLIGHLQLVKRAAMAELLAETTISGEQDADASPGAEEKR